MVLAVSVDEFTVSTSTVTIVTAWDIEFRVALLSLKSVDSLTWRWVLVWTVWVLTIWEEVTWNIGLNWSLSSSVSL